jgi:alpha-1,3-mannosyltransferase
VVRNGLSGWLIDQDAIGLAAAMERGLSMPQEKLAEMGDAARSATRRFSWSQIAPRYEQLYRDVLAVQQRSPAQLS